jgi:hypothetical protein
MYRNIYLVAVTLSLAGVMSAACENRRDASRGETSPGTETGRTSETVNTSDTVKTGAPGTGGDTGKLSEADKKAGRTLETPGDSIRLEDTLSIPPASSDTTREGQ